VDLATVHISEAKRLVLPAWAREVIPGPGDAPLLYAGLREGYATAVLAFEPRRSDLPLQVAFPVLLANLAGELFGRSATPAEAVAPGSPVSLPIPAGAIGVRVQRPDGSVDELVAPAGAGGSVTFSRTDLLGIYTVTAIPDPDTTPAPSATPIPLGTSAPSGYAAPSGSAAPAASPTPAPPAAASGPSHFAVDLLDVDESRIAPGNASVLEALGAARTSPGTSSTGIDPRPAARDELWIPIVLLALVILTAEWLIYERDTLARLRRSLGARLRHDRTAGGRA